MKSKDKGQKVLFTVIVAIFVLSIIIIPLSTMFGGSQQDPAQVASSEQEEKFDPENNGVDGVVAKEGDKYYLDMAGVRFFQLKGSEKINLDEYIDKNVKVFGPIGQGENENSIVLNVQKIKLQ